MKKKRRDTMKKKREDERENEKREMKKGEKSFFFPKHVSGPSKPPDELAQNVSNKSLSDELFLHFSSEVRNLTVFSIIYMIRIHFSGREN